MAKTVANLALASILALPDDTFVQVTRLGVVEQISLGNLREAVSADSVQAASPLTGATVLLTDNSSNNTLNLTPAGTIAALTVTLPSDALSVIGQVVTLTTSATVTALTVNGATTIRGNVTTLAANAFVSFRKLAANTWARVA